MPLGLNRRAFGALSLAVLATPGFAFTAADATSVVEAALVDVQSTIDTGKTGNALYRDFEKIFDEYADVPLVAAGSLGITWRSASNAQKRRYTNAFASYLAEKYGKRFAEFAGATYEVTKTEETKRGYAVFTDLALPSGSNFELEWQVRETGGEYRIFDITIEGISMLISERTEIGAMLDARGGDLDKLIADLG